MSKSKQPHEHNDPAVPGSLTEAQVRGELTGVIGHGAVDKMTWGECIDALTSHYADTDEGAPADQPDDFDDLSEFDDLGLDDVPAAPSLFIGMPTTKDYIFDGHAGAGPSGAERWMNCTASLAAARAFLETLTPNQQEVFARSGTAARQGTTAHAAAASEAMLMLGQIEQSEHDATLLELSLLPEDQGEAYDEEMAEWIIEYGDLVRQYHQSGHEVLIETRVEAAIELQTVDADGEPNVHVIAGSADAVALPTPEENVLAVVDLKYGNGKNVEATDNPQAMIYALAVLAVLMERGIDIFALDGIDIIIVQPRLGGIKTWRITVDDLLDWRDDVLSPALTEALGGAKAGAAFKPSETACQFCPARGSCPALIEERTAAAAELFDVIIEAEHVGDEFPDIALMDSETLGRMLAQVEGLTKIKDDLKAEAQRRLHRGSEVPGYQLVNYTPPRTWVDNAADDLDPGNKSHGVLPEEVAEQLWTPRKLRTPTQALAALKKEGLEESLLEDLIEVHDKRPVVAREGDRRKTWEGRPPEAMFDVEDEA